MRLFLIDSDLQSTSIFHSWIHIPHESSQNKHLKYATAMRLKIKHYQCLKYKFLWCPGLVYLPNCLNKFLQAKSAYLIYPVNKCMSGSSHCMSGAPWRRNSAFIGNISLSGLCKSSRFVLLLFSKIKVTLKNG